jgi:hypothetical protein
VSLEISASTSSWDRHIQKEREKAYHDRHIKRKAFKQGDMVLVYDNKFMKHPWKFKTHWLGPYEVAYVTEGGVAHLKTMNGEWKEGLVNGSRLKLYYDNQLPHNS